MFSHARQRLCGIPNNNDMYMSCENNNNFYAFIIESILIWKAQRITKNRDSEGLNAE